MVTCSAERCGSRAPAEARRACSAAARRHGGAGGAGGGGPSAPAFSLRFAPGWSHSESCRAIPSHSESFRVIPSHSESFRVIPSHSESFRVIPSHLESSRDWHRDSERPRFGVAVPRPFCPGTHRDKKGQKGTKRDKRRARRRAPFTARPAVRPRPNRRSHAIRDRACARRRRTRVGGGSCSTPSLLVTDQVGPVLPD